MSKTLMATPFEHAAYVTKIHVWPDGSPVIGSKGEVLRLLLHQPPFHRSPRLAKAIDIIS